MSNEANSKQRGNKSQTPPYDETRFAYYEALNLSAEDTAKSRVDIPFRISYNFFIFVKNEKFISSADTSEYIRRWLFTAKADISIELLDQEGVSVARELLRKEIGTNEPERTTHRNEFLQGIFSFVLPPGEYTAVFQVDDLESDQQFLDKSKKFVLHNFSKKAIEISDVLFIEPLKDQRQDVKEFIPVNLGGDVFFSRDFDAYCEISYNATSLNALRLTYSLYKFDETRGDTTFYIRDSLAQNAIANPFTLDILRTETSYLYRLKESSAPRKLASMLQLKGEQLPQGKYELRILVSDGMNSQIHLHPFNVRWVNMPRSLYDLEFAVEVLDYIASKEEKSDLKAMFTKRQKKKFDDFWKKRDPTPNTALNEAMAEYYRRVDYTLENFNTMKVQNGYKTDRGKVYILYGQPTNTERKFSPTAPPKEIWVYENLKKRFVFIDENRSGDYKLAATENL